MKKNDWRIWEILARSKLAGGLGFRELETFYAAFLRNVAAKILNEPEALWVRTLKGLYFPNTDLLSTRKRGRASWGWPSIIQDYDVIKQEGLWKIGDGEDV